MGPVNYAGVGHSVPIHAVDSPSLYSANGNSAALYHIFFFHCGTKLIPDNAQGFVIFYICSFDVSLKTKEPSVFGLVALETPPFCLF